MRRKTPSSVQAHNPAKLERCVRKVKARGTARNAYAVCTAALKKSKRKKNRAPRAKPSFIHIQKHGRGPVLTYTTTGSFSTPQHGVKFHGFATSALAHKAATRMLAKFSVLDSYKIWVSKGGSVRRANPSQREKLDVAAEKLENFTGHEVTHVERARTRSDEKTGLVIGGLTHVVYEATRDGKTELHEHPFRKRSRPLLAVSTDGKQLHIVGGRYEFTDAGIEDR